MVLGFLFLHQLAVHRLESFGVQGLDGHGAAWLHHGLFSIYAASPLLELHPLTAISSAATTPAAGQQPQQEKHEVLDTHDKHENHRDNHCHRNAEYLEGQITRRCSQSGLLPR
jgi:hypothetical protein